jgi:hypothetical protein
MPRCAADPVEWKSRRAYRISNGAVELTVLVGGGHIADFRLCGSPINTIWEAPWPTIEPQTFSLIEHGPLYGDGAAARMLCGYTGHALALGYFGMPSSSEAAQGLPLHGEAVGSEWKLVGLECKDESVSLTLEVHLPVYQLQFQRRIALRSDSIRALVQENVTNANDEPVEFQWVEHAAFGEPLFTEREASLFLSGTRGMTWHLGYEGRELLPNDLEFCWPKVYSNEGIALDLSSPFLQDRTGFVASVLTDASRTDGFVAVHNRQHALVAGYSFDRNRFPWIALWEENRARSYPPWNGVTRVRGVEFGTSPMPLGLQQARENGTMFDTPVLTRLAPQSSVETQYQMFVSPVPPQWKAIHNVFDSGSHLVVRGDGHQEVIL